MHKRAPKPSEEEERVEPIDTQAQAKILTDLKLAAEKDDIFNRNLVVLLHVVAVFLFVYAIANPLPSRAKWRYLLDVCTLATSTFLVFSSSSSSGSGRKLSLLWHGFVGDSKWLGWTCILFLGTSSYFDFASLEDPSLMDALSALMPLAMLVFAVVLKGMEENTQDELRRLEKLTYNYKSV